MRVCLIYDCLFPYTVGGGERWYRAVAERLAADGHQVTYLTLRQWPRDEPPALPGIAVIPVGPRLSLYVDGRRRVLPPIVFGAGVLWHLLRHRRSYDVVQTASFPYFSLLAAGVLRWSGAAHYRLVVDWFEVWTRAYWREYIGRIGGTVGWAVQRLCTRIPQRAFCLSRLHANRLRQEGYAGEVVVLGGIYDGDLSQPRPEPADPVVVFIGRHVPEKRVPALIPAIALARRHLPELRGIIFGDGPDRVEVERLIDSQGLNGIVDLPGFVDHTTLETALRRALCLLQPSRREGYGLVVVEAAAHGIPSIVVAGPDNAATELIVDGENGIIASSASAPDLAAAIVRIWDAGPALRTSTAEWFAREAPRRTLNASLDMVAAAYGDRPAAGGPAPAQTRPAASARLTDRP